MTSVTTDTTPPRPGLYSICKGLEQLNNNFDWDQPDAGDKYDDYVASRPSEMRTCLCWSGEEIGFICNQNGKVQWRSLKKMAKLHWEINKQEIAEAVTKALKPIKKPSQEQLILVNNVEKKDLLEEIDKLKKLHSACVTKLKEYKNRQIELIKKIDKQKLQIVADEELEESNEHDLKNMSIVLTNLFRTFTNEQQRKEWAAKMASIINKADKKGLDRFFCEDCGQFSVYQEGSTKKCIHTDCPGMCTGCFNIKNPEGFEVCSCCNKKQELKCPVCYINQQPEMIVKGSNCCHHVCKGCMYDAIVANAPIKDCPLCRAKF